MLGSFTVGDHAKIGAGSVVLKEVPPHATVVGIPGRVVVMGGQRVHTLDEMKRAQASLPLAEGEEERELEEEFDVDLDHCSLPDPDAELQQSMLEAIHALEKKVAELEQKLEEKHAESL